MIHPPPTKKMPFVPYRLFTNLTHYGLPGDDMRDVSAAFFFAVTQTVFRANIAKFAGTAPPRTATKYLGMTTAGDAGGGKVGKAA